jgi:vesicle-associated membrane protein 7
MTRHERGSIPSFGGTPLPPNINTTTQQPRDTEHTTLLSRGLISPTKKTPKPQIPTPKKHARAKRTPSPAMASSSSTPPLL